MRRGVVRILCCLIPIRKVRHAIRRHLRSMPKGIVDVFIIDKNNKERLATSSETKHISVREIGGHYKNNVIRIEDSVSDKLRLGIQISGNNSIFIGHNVRGILHVDLLGDDNSVEINEGTTCNGVDVHLCGHKLVIGKDCMLAHQICIWGDSHSVLDYNTGAVLNKPNRPIIVGDHCWIGERVTLTKNAQLPNDCIVGIASVVTKKFTEEHSVIAGAPAKVVKTGITWHGVSPLKYEDFIKKEQVKNG